MVVSHVMHKKPIIGSHYVPYRETGTRAFGLYLWWAFCMKKSMKNTIKFLLQMGLAMYLFFIVWMFIKGVFDQTHERVIVMALLSVIVFALLDKINFRNAGQKNVDSF
jgi:hypothetical protein